jgi:hypothetical protein
MMLFFADVRVKENRKTLLCKKRGGTAEICEIEGANLKGASAWGGEGAATRFKKEDGDTRSRLQAKAPV